MIIILGILGALLCLGASSPSSPPAGPLVQSLPGQPGPADSLIHRTIVGKPGAWGQLEWLSIVLEPPDSYCRPDDCLSDFIPWYFGNSSLGSLADLWQSANLSQEQQRRLLASAQCDPFKRSCTVLPPPDIILSLTPAARRLIYTVLSQYPQNVFYAKALKVRLTAQPYWLSNRHLPQPAFDIFKKLLYQDENYLLFSDFPLLCSQLKSDREKQILIKLISRTRTLLVKLLIAPETDIEQLSQYWGRGWNSKSIHSLLDSLHDIPGGAKIDIAHLLPKFARMLLYTYPKPENQKQDCHWTSLNFFGETIDDRFLDGEYVTSYLAKEYHPIEMSQRQLGDVLIYANAEGNALHSAVYIADDIIFTKNGRTFLQPWIFMKIEDLTSLYASQKSTRMIWYRQN
jgi:hypothetical protein